MHMAILQHMPVEGPGHIALWGQKRGHTMSLHHLYRGEALPKAGDCDLLVVLGGGMSVHDTAIYPWLGDERALIRDVLAAGKAVVGICLGAQQIALALGAAVGPNAQREVGFWPIRRVGAGLPLPEELTVLHWHGESFDLPQGALRLASSEACPQQIVLAAAGRALGLQCHMEATPEMVADFCREDADYLVPPPGQGRWMQDAQTMQAERAAYAPMHQALEGLLDAFIQGAFAGGQNG